MSIIIRIIYFQFSNKKNFRQSHKNCHLGPNNCQVNFYFLNSYVIYWFYFVNFHFNFQLAAFLHCSIFYFCYFLTKVFNHIFVFIYLFIFYYFLQLFYYSYCFFYHLFKYGFSHVYTSNHFLKHIYHHFTHLNLSIMMLFSMQHKILLTWKS